MEGVTAKEGWCKDLTLFFCYKPNSRTFICVHVFCLTLPQMAWQGFLCHDPKSNSRQYSCNSLRDLNSGHFYNWATRATAPYRWKWHAFEIFTLNHILPACTAVPRSKQSQCGISGCGTGPRARGSWRWWRRRWPGSAVRRSSPCTWGWSP